MLGRLCTKAPNVAPVEVADRRPTMGKFLLHLAELDKPLVVETGCQRADDDYGAGMSTQIFGRFLARRGGRLLSIDNNGRNVNFARSRTQGLPVDVIREDSVAWLSKFDWPQADGVYLDSADVGEPGYQEHCLREAQAASTRAKAQFMLIDDTVKTKHGWWGKGALAVPWLQANGWEIEEAGYQVLLRRAS
jgi:predicted O-methyltransferase YrrM